MLQTNLFDDVKIPIKTLSVIPTFEKGFNSDDDFEDKLDAVKRAFYKMWDSGKHCLLLSSYGKDSSTLLGLGLQNCFYVRKYR